jgi:hypothetical protein
MAGMAPLIVLVHSPNLGPSTWQPVASVLAAAGHEVVAPSLAGFAAGGPPYVPRLVGLIAGQAGAGARDDVVLVPHSGAGVFVPHLAAALAPGRVTAVFADASLPGQAAPGTVVEAEFLPFLRGLARDGTVPPWPRWWPDEDLSSLFGDEATRQVVTGEAAALPLAYFEEALPVLPGGWPPCHAAYLAFSEPYRREAGAATHAGWPVRELHGEHLHMLIRPAEVAAAITSLAAQARAGAASLRSLP